MRTLVLLAATAVFSHAAAADITYDITVQNENGIELHTLTLPLSGPTQTLLMARGVVEVTPPGQQEGPSIVKLYAAGRTASEALHTARIARPQDDTIRIAYSICGATVTFHSPAPDKLEGCGMQGTATAKQAASP